VRRYQFYGVMVAEWGDVIFCCEKCLRFSEEYFCEKGFSGD
jgi:predicted RNA-binding Zn-ribbon protein involved in translation (DUF1610 family)